MKKFILAGILALIVAAAPRPAIAAEGNYFGEVWGKLYADPRFTILESVQPTYFYDLVEGTNQGGAVTKFYALGEGGIFTVDAGWVGNIENGSQPGAALLGVSIHADKLGRVILPQINETLRAYIPSTAMKFVDALTFGPAFAYNSDKERLTAGLAASIELHF